LTDSALLDRGLQPERTALAWRRTTLALAVGAIVALRLLSPVLGLWSIAIGLTGLALAAVLWVLSAHEHTRQRMPCRTSPATSPAADCS
jgi:putative membrane protein